MTLGVSPTAMLPIFIVVQECIQKMDLDEVHHSADESLLGSRIACSKEGHWQLYAYASRHEHPGGDSRAAAATHG